MSFGIDPRNLSQGLLDIFWGRSGDLLHKRPDLHKVKVPIIIMAHDFGTNKERKMNKVSK